MTTLRIYANRHIRHQVKKVEYGDTIYLENRLSRKRWEIYFRSLGIDETKLNLTYVTHEEFLKLTKYFDAVVGNAPFQKENNDAKRWVLWIEILNKAKTLSDVVCMVTPQSVTSPSMFPIIKDNLKVLNIDVSKNFGNIGSTFCYFVYDKNYKGDTDIITSSGVFKIDTKKVDFLPFVIDENTIDKLKMLENRKSRVWKRGEIHTSNKHLLSESGKFEILHTNAQMLKTDTIHPNKDKIRVVVSLSGYPMFNVIEGKYCSQACMWTEFNSLKSAKQFAKECNGVDIQNMMNTFKWSGWNSKEVIESL